MSTVKFSKKPALQVMFDMLEYAGKPEYNPSGCRDQAMIRRIEARRHVIITLLEVLKRMSVPVRQRQNAIKRLTELRNECAFPAIGYSEIIHGFKQESGVTPKCSECNDTGVIETGNDDLPCDCLAGDKAYFNQAGVDGPVTGAEIKRHFLNDSPEPIETGHGIRASDLPGRK